MEKLEYPKWKYHRTLPAAIVNSPEEDEALGEGWAETPAAFAADSAPALKPTASEPASESEPNAFELGAALRAVERAERAAKKNRGK